ncbi:hypothetical protein COHA_004986 [Chlorella ohadii]|uniref:Uncharacterized protein n=1 Tax=Chlorella ohadii TaxID=2649997 RepID=A0AAD5H586_9CHLO|nr:hypothetical protein COHA_004986 [Chlorella ohadii]
MTWARGSLACNGTLSEYDITQVLDDFFYDAQSVPAASITFQNANLTGIRLAYATAAAFKTPVSPFLKLSIVDSVIARNQLVLFGAAAAQLNLAIDVQVVNSRILDNMLVAAAAASVGGSASASLSMVNSEVSGNMVAAAGALAISNSASASASGTGGSARNNALMAAGLVATGSEASARADFGTVDGSDNTAMVAGLPFVNQPLVTSIIKTVMDSVFVSSSGLSASLANVQTQLCTSMAPGGSIEQWASNVVDLSGVMRVASNLLCSAGSSIRLSDIPGMIDGTVAPGAMNTFQAVKMLAMGEGQVGIKSAAGLARAMASHPDAIGAILKQLTVQPKN